MADKTNFPSHLISPKLKNKDWIMKYVKAAWEQHGGISHNMFYPNRIRYSIIKSYAMGRQAIDKYKAQLKADEDKDFSWLSIDWSILPIVAKFRRIALGKLMKTEYNIVATPIDAQSRVEQDAYYNEIRTKIVMRQQLMQLAPEEAAAATVLMPEAGEPQDLEELEMQMTYGYKHQKSIEAEEGIQLIFYQNDIDYYRTQILEDLFDYGVCLYKDWIDSNGMVRFRRVDPRNVVMNHCKYGDFRDRQYCGELYDMSISDLKEDAGAQFTDEQYEEILEQSCRGKVYAYGERRDNTKLQVLDIDFYSHNDIVREQRINKNNNLVYGAADYNDAKKDKEKYVKKQVKVYYTAKWIVGTDYIYNYGLGTDMKRAKSSMMETVMCFEAFAPDFFEMTSLGMMEQLIPIADQIQIAWYRLQNTMNKAVPKGWEIDLDALESVAIGKGGAMMKPLDLIDMFQKTGVLVTRRKDISERNINYKAIQEMPNGMGNDVTEYWNSILNNIQMLRDITGLNEFTDGSTPNPKTNIPVAEMAYESTNNSLYFIQNGEKQMLIKLAKAVILRLQDTVLRGNVEGYIKSLGTNTIKFIKVGKGISEAEFGIMIENKPTDQQRQMLMQHIEQYLATDMLDPSDSIIVESTWNLKHAQQLLAYKVNKRRNQKQQEAAMMQEQNGMIQIQSAQAAEEMKQKTLEKEYALKMELMNLQKEWDYKIQELIVQSRGDEMVAGKTLDMLNEHSLQEQKLGLGNGEQMPGFGESGEMNEAEMENDKAMLNELAAQ